MKITELENWKISNGLSWRLSSMLLEGHRYRVVIVKLSMVTIACCCFTSCTKKCVTCAIEDKHGTLIAVNGECNTSTSYLDGWVDGLKLYYDEKGDSSQVQCLPAK